MANLIPPLGSINNMTVLPASPGMNGTEKIPIVYTGVVANYTITTTVLRTWLQTAAAWPVSAGGTGVTTLTAHGVVIGQGTSPVHVTAVGTNGQLFLGQTAADPAWGTMSGDASITQTGAVTVAQVNGVAYGTSPSTNTVPVVTGANTITYEAVPNAALANSTLTLGSTTLTLGGTTTAVTGLSLDSSPIGATTPSTGKFTTLQATGAVTLSPASANVVLSPTGTGVVTINPATAGTIDNEVIGGTTPLAATVTTLQANTSATVGKAGGSTGTLALVGTTSGTATITAQATAGTPTLTLPNTSGTLASNIGGSSSGGLTLSATTGALVLAQGLWINRQIFSSVGTATYTPTAGTNFVFVRVIAGGGGGGGCTTTGASTISAAGGGGAGGYVEKRITSSFSGVTVTVGGAGSAGVANGANGGTGGTSSFGALISATGGSGAGTPGTGTPPIFGGNGNTSGAGSSGDLNGGGTWGLSGIGLGTASVLGGSGGSLSPYGSGGRSVSTTTSAAGVAGTGFGAGGSGGAAAASQTGVGGGAGTQGLVIVDEYQ